MTPIRPDTARADHDKDQQTGERTASVACEGDSCKMACGPFVAKGLAAYRNGTGEHAV